LAQLAVGEAKAPDYLTDDLKALRRRLRAHGRALGDAKHPDDTQEVRRLVWEAAYEHWHRMLFARFLAENGLLLWEPGAPVSLDDCRDLVDHHPELALGAKSQWELAGRLAARMLPQVFKPHSPVFELTFAPEHQRALERLLADLPTEVFRASDSLGWVYQFWQAKRKDEVNASEVKIGADELPAVTQLFTEPYMVDFLLHNSLGAWWVTRHPDQPCPVPLTYLRLLPSPPGRGVGGEGEPVVRAPHHRHVPPEQIEFARQLRQSQTDAEHLIWSLVRDRRLAGHKFRRQHPVGPYVLDFYCHEKRLAIELDGGQHNEEAGRHADARRTETLAREGIRVVRFWNNQVLLETEAVLEAIWQALALDSPSPPAPLPGGEGSVAGGEGRREPAAGRFEGWPDTLKAFKLLDPCCGSGHFLVAAFLLLVPMRMAAEDLSAREAVDAVLADNLHGLELDARCVEIAVFALALAAWRYPDLPSPSGRGAGGEGAPLGVRAEMPAPNIACCGLKVAASAKDWEALVPDSQANAALLRQELRLLHAAFAQAPLLGSLLDPARSLKDDLFKSSFDDLKDLLELALATEPSPLPPGEGPGVRADDAWDLALTARGLLDAARLLDARYHLVITNVPYLARGKQNDTLKDYCAKHYPEAKNDLANVFLERCLELCVGAASSRFPSSREHLPGKETHPEGASTGVVQIVMPQNWLFLSSYKKQRESLLRRVQWNLLARLGMAAFEIMDWWAFNVILLTQTRATATECFQMYGVDASTPKAVQEKAALLREGVLVEIQQAEQCKHPDARVLLDRVGAGELLDAFADFGKGSTTGDRLRFLRGFWELEELSVRNVPWLDSPTEGDMWSGRESVTTVTLNEPTLRQQLGCWLRGQELWGRVGFAVNKMRGLEPFLYSGETFDDNVGIVAPRNKEHLPALWAFVQSGQYLVEIRKIDQKLNVTAATLTKVPFDLPHWQQVAAERYPHGLPKPYSDDPTQWLFHGHPQPATDPLQVAFARLLGYRWPAEQPSPPAPLPGGEGSQEMELSDEARVWIARCEQLHTPLPLGEGPGVRAHVDDDGIVCLSSVRGEPPAHDRLLALLIAAWETVEPGSWRPSILAKLLADADCAGKDLEVWLRDKFFEQHARRFHHRPFIWHVWDGLKDGFGALVNYHKLDARNLERLIHTYLGDWTRQQEAGVRDGLDGAQIRLAAAQDLKRRLELILEGEFDGKVGFDIFVRWKPLAEQPIGWNPDLNDGVRLNIRPFMTAGVLRHNKKPKLNIGWDKDRGKDVESAPWYGVFKGERINDHHLKLAEKLAARGRSS
jgi:very-short-patch-repair endonuclease